MAFKEAAIDYLDRVVHAEEFIVSTYHRRRASLNTFLFGLYDVEMLLRDIVERSISPSIASLESRLSNTDPRIVGDTVLTWIKNYTVEEAARVMGVPECDVVEIRRELGLTPKDTPRRAYGLEEGVYAHLQKKREEYTPENPLRVMMGTTPSGPLHLANMFTLATGAVSVQRAVERLGIKDVQYTLGYNDLFALINGHSREEVLSRKAGVEKFLDEMNKVYGIEIVLEPFSELQRTEAFRATLAEVARRRLFPGGTTWGVANNLAVARKNTNHFRRMNRNFNYEAFMESEHLDYVPVNLLDLMAFRDAANKVDIHILGGDQTHVGKIIDPGRFVGDKEFAIYVTGIVFAPDGREMHVSRNNAISLDEINGVDRWLERIVDLRNVPTRLIGPLEYRTLLPHGTKLYEERRVQKEYR